MTPAIAIVGMACCYPDAHSPAELWENVLAQRRSFRRMPSERLNLSDYWSSNPTVPDRTYASEAALIEGYEFDRVDFRVVGSTFRSADLAHWLALDIANRALADAGFPNAEGIPRESTGVLLGNTLTGEFSRANTMRLRWPYVRRVVEATLSQTNYPPEHCSALVKMLEQQYKQPFPEISEETLAGNLSNTIAGRICNYFDFKGGGYAVDGACSSSLLAIAHACSGLVSGDFDVALAGGVDLSLDPFELVGFAKAGALATDEMRVYDARSTGFWPGEGCGFVVLMRHADAIVQNCPIYAVIRGWGVSSDGHGGMTRPEVEGQLLALQRAYRRAGFGIDTVTYFEGHGTGTSVGDATELKTLSRARQESNPDAPVAVISSIKANIGHTKAAAGIAGLIKATLALHHQVIPPMPMCDQPHGLLTATDAALRVLPQGKLWSEDTPLRAGVGAMGFGGINAHIVLEGNNGDRRHSLNHNEKILLHSPQDAELFLFQAQQVDQLQQQVAQVLEIAPRLSRAEVTDLAVHLAQSLSPGTVRVAIVAGTPMELTTRLEVLATWLKEGITERLEPDTGIFLGKRTTPSRLGFLFPGQASPTYFNGGCWEHRFDQVRDLYAQNPLPQPEDGKATAIAQPAIVKASKAALLVLEQLGLTADIAIGHSLGEITALHWAGAFDQDALLGITQVRGQAITDFGSATGAMASIRSSQQVIRQLINGYPVVIAGLNTPQQTIISGEVDAIISIINKAQAQGLKAVTLSVSHAFHSDLVSAAAEPLAKHLVTETIQPLQRKVISTVTGSLLTAETDVRSLLYQQVTAPVRFLEAITQASQEVDLWIEVGPGRVLSRLAKDCVETPAIALDASGPSLQGLLQAVGAAFVMGSSIDPNALFSDRFTRPFNLDWQPKFFVNPCELAPQLQLQEVSISTSDNGKTSIPKTALVSQMGIEAGGKGFDAYHLTEQSIVNQKTWETPKELLRQLVAQRIELPTTAIQDNHRLLSDLHLNSITVGQLVAEAARSLALEPSAAPTNYADATVAEVAQALGDLVRTGRSTPIDGVNQPPSGIDAWVRTFTVEWRDRPLSSQPHSLDPEGRWQILTASNTPFAEVLQEAFQSFPGQGVVVYLSVEEDKQTIDCLLSGAQQVLAQDENTHFVLVQHAPIGGGVARTFHLENPQITTCVVTIPEDHPQSVIYILAEVQAAKGYIEASYDHQGNRQVPILQLLQLEQWQQAAPEIPLTVTDVLLVTGGGKGIAAECALALARETGVRLALLGRSHPDTDDELFHNLERMRVSGVEVLYEAADVTDVQALQRAVQKFETQFGPITAVLHGAGVNTPQLLTTLTPADFHKTLGPKVEGLNNLLSTVNPQALKLLITFGSLIARTGLRGEADYALANEWLANLVEKFQHAQPSCRCLNLEWSIWSGVGMGERLGRVDVLLREGITPISPDIGISILRQLVAQPLPVTSVVITGRFGEAPTLRMEHPEFPFLRFLEQPRIYYPGIELVVDADLSVGTDPYLNDHVYQGERIFPAVMGLEAMAQVVTALAGPLKSICFEDVQFNRPVVVPANDSLKIRIAALVRSHNYVDVVIRTEQTAFQVDHFRATYSISHNSTLKPHNHIQKSIVQQQNSLSSLFGSPNSTTECVISLHPDQDLYGGILFHSGRFRRLRQYHKLRAKECIAELLPEQESLWFSPYLPADFRLGDPAARDAAIHGLQACIPHVTLLPAGVKQIVINPGLFEQPRYIHAQERSQFQNTFIYDLEILSEDGKVLERWEGLCLKVIGSVNTQQTWAAPLLGPYLERQIHELIPGADIAVVVDKDTSIERKVKRDRTIENILSNGNGTSTSLHPPVLTHRPDGKPEVITDATGIHQDKSVSVSYTGELMLAVAGATLIGCDVEPVVCRTLELWQDLLSAERFSLAQLLVHEAGQDLDTAATCIWTACECLKKAGVIVTAPLVLNSSAPEGWIVLNTGSLIIATCVVSVQDIQEKLVLSVLTQKELKNVEY